MGPEGPPGPPGPKGDKGDAGAATLPDTGWRDVTARLTAVVTGGTVLVRRIGDVVYWRFTAIKTSSGGDLLTDASVMAPFTHESSTVWPPRHQGTFVPVWVSGTAGAPNWLAISRSTTHQSGFIASPVAISSPSSGDGQYISNKPFPTMPYPGVPA